MSHVFGTVAVRKESLDEFDDRSFEPSPNLRLEHVCNNAFIELSKVAAEMCTESMAYIGSTLARPGSWGSSAKSTATPTAFRR